MGHSEECRRRIEDFLQQSDSGKDRLQRANARAENWTSEEIKRSDTRAPQDEPEHRDEDEVIDMEDAPAVDTSQRSNAVAGVSDI